MLRATMIVASPVIKIGPLGPRVQILYITFLYYRSLNDILATSSLLHAPFRAVARQKYDRDTFHEKKL